MSASLPYSDIHLSRRLERTEAMSAASHVESHRRNDPGCGAEWREIGGAIALYDGPSSPVTQTFGLGMAEPPESRHFDALESFYRERGAHIHHETSPMADPALWTLLGERGYRPIEFSAVLYQTPRMPSTAPSLRARPIGPEERDTWVRVAVRGWRAEAGLEDSLESLMRVVEQRNDVLLFLADFDGRPVAAAALNIVDGVALFAGACTIPEARGNGAQRALLDARMAFAAESGCDLAMMVAQAGSASQRNAERAGFRIAYTRIKWQLS
jgi:GNAT superfamily N-acetyltransferase